MKRSSKNEMLVHHPVISMVLLVLAISITEAVIQLAFGVSSTTAAGIVLGGAVAYFLVRWWRRGRG